jgi:hypothetical protein
MIATDELGVYTHEVKFYSMQIPEYPSEFSYLKIKDEQWQPKWPTHSVNNPLIWVRSRKYFLIKACYCEK